jgi:crossover junction endodeoxyribonuclease RusA
MTAEALQQMMEVESRSASAAGGIAFRIEGDPSTNTSQQKGACVLGKRVMFYTKAAVAAEKRRIKAGAFAHRPKTPMDGPIRMTAVFYFPIGITLAKSWVEHLSDLLFVRWKTSKPDADNSGKLLLDSLTDSGFWGDDAQVCLLTLGKVYSTDPRIEVCIRPLRESSP